MREYINQSKKQSRTLDNTSKVPCQLPLSEVLQSYKQRTWATEPVQEDWHVIRQMQGKIQPTVQMQEGNIIQRAALWWKTNEDHTQVTSGSLTEQPADGEKFVKKQNAGNSDEVFSTEDDAWDRAKEVAFAKRPHNIELFKETQKKMITGDGNRTYYSKEGIKKDVSIIVTHNKDPQSKFETETGEVLKVVHTHSATKRWQDVKKAIDSGGHPGYSNSSEANVHYLSLTLQQGE